MDPLLLIVSFIAAILAGLINAVAGGGTLITFPILTALGLPAISANITNTIALVPGYLGGTYAQLNDIKNQRKRLLLLSPLCIAGGVTGGVLLLKTGEKNFRELIPYLILFATILLAIQPLVKIWLGKNHRIKSHHKALLSGLLIILPAALYGGYFGAGVSVIIIAALAIVYDDSITRLNALKQMMSFIINCSTAIFFLFSGQVNWPVAAVMALGAVAGGYLGGRIAGKLNPSILRWVIILIGLIVSAIYFYN
jgi:uncharacterized protein